MTYLSIDLGSQRVGIAISDRKGLIAEPFSTISRENDEDLLSEISNICKEKKVDAVVIGVPYSARKEVQDSFRQFGKDVAKSTGLPIYEWDETFSTKQAQNVVAFADQPTTRRKTRTHRDEVAAAVILQEFLDNEYSKKNGSRNSGYTAD